MSANTPASMPGSTHESKHEFANICRHLNDAALQIPDSLAVAVQSHYGLGLFSSKREHFDELTFSDLDKMSDQLAFGLEQAGLQAGMKAVLMVTPSLAFFSLTFALFKAGIIPILVDPGMGVTNLKQCFIESAPDAFIGIPKAHVARKLFGWGKSSIKHLVTVNDGSALGKLVSSGISYSALSQHNESQPYSIAKLKPDEMAAILFTSGSTGTPKGVVYSHRMFEAQISALKHDYGIEPGERDLATFPLFSLFGPALGMASIVPDMDASKPITADPNYLFSAIEKYQCSNMFVNPALIERLGQAGVATAGTKESEPRTLTSIRRVISAGAPATIASIERFSKMLNPGIEVLNSYGATESLPISKIASHELFDTTSVTDTGGGICVGRAIDGVEIQIIEIDESPINDWQSVKTLAANQIGEIVVKGPMVSASYYCRESATQAAKIRDGIGNDKLVRHRMGDLGYLDDTGRLWMCGRKAHRVDITLASGELKRYFSIPSERIFNVHSDVKRSALVEVNIGGKPTPLVCLELNGQLSCGNSAKLFSELCAIAEQYSQTQGIQRFLIHPSFPVDIRHNAKIFREKLAVWAQKQIKE